MPNIGILMHLRKCRGSFFPLRELRRLGVLIQGGKLRQSVQAKRPDRGHFSTRNEKVILRHRHTSRAKKQAPKRSHSIKATNAPHGPPRSL